MSEENLDHHQLKRSQTHESRNPHGLRYKFNIPRSEEYTQEFEEFQKNWRPVITKNGYEFDVEYDYVESENLVDPIRSFTLYKARQVRSANQIKITMSVRFYEAEKCNEFHEEIKVFLTKIDQNQSKNLNLEKRIIKKLRNPFFFILLCCGIIAFIWLFQLI